MDEFAAEQPTDAPLTAPRWTGTPSIPMAYALNEQWIEVFCELAATPAVQAPPRFILHNREFWCRLDTEARHRAAAFPFVIVDLDFKNDERWQTLKNQANPIDPAPDTFPRKLCDDLLFDTLSFARQTALEDVDVARVIFGMTLSVARQVAKLTARQIRSIAYGGTGLLGVRWADNADFWREVAIAARLADDEALKALRHHAKLLFCGEITRPVLGNP